jgi:chitin disaccharide deacetylase
MKYLVLNGDDFGMCHSVNLGAVRGFTEGLLTQVSIMAPAPWFEEAVALALQYRIPTGVHLTATCDWDRYRWRPLTVGRSLVRNDGTFYSSVDEEKEHADPAELEAEYIAQVERVIASGIVPQHLDVHMGMVNDKVFAKICEKYKLPAMPSPCIAKADRIDLCYQFDTWPGSRRSREEELFSYLPINKKNDLLRQYLMELPEGKHFNICHPAVDSDELSSLCSANYKNWEWARDIRVTDLEAITSAETMQFCRHASILRGSLLPLC